MYMKYGKTKKLNTISVVTNTIWLFAPFINKFFLNKTRGDWMAIRDHVVQTKRRLSIFVGT